MPTLDEKQERGMAFISGKLGSEFGEAMRGGAESDAFASEIARMSLTHAFVDAWGHSGLEMKMKSIAIISALIAMRQPGELKNHVKIGIANGLTLAEFEGLLIQLTPYVGYPCIASATNAMIEALREGGLDPNAKTSEEIGLL